MHKIKLISALAILTAMMTGCVTVPANPRPKTPSRIHGEAGQTIESYLISIDADYEERLDNLLPGYKIVPVMIRNVSLRHLPMDVHKDHWFLVGEKGKVYRALNSLKLKDPVAWRKMPDDLRSAMDYPEIIPMNYSVTFDLLLPRAANLEYFKEIIYDSATLKKEFVIEKEY